MSEDLKVEFQPAKPSLYTFYRNEPVWKNESSFLMVDKKESYFLRRRRAAQVMSTDFPSAFYNKFFLTISSKYPRPEGSSYTHYSGIVVPVDNQSDKTQFDVFISPASHYEIWRSILQKKDVPWPNPDLGLFSINYVADKITNKRLLIVDFRRAAHNNEEGQLKAIVDKYQPSYYFYKTPKSSIFVAPKY